MFVVCDERVVPVSADSVLKGQFSQNECEEHHTEGKHVCRLAVVAIGRCESGPMDLRGHVASLGAFAVADEWALKREVGCESKICQFGSEA